MNSLSKLEHRNKTLIAAICNRAYGKVADFEVIDSALLFSALSKLRHYDKDLVALLCEAMLLKTRQFSAKAISSTSKLIVRRLLFLSHYF